MFRYTLFILLFSIRYIFGQVQCSNFTVTINNLQVCVGGQAIISAEIRIGNTTRPNNLYRFTWQIKENGSFRNITPINNNPNINNGTLTYNNTPFTLNNAEHRCIARLNSNTACTSTSNSSSLTVVPLPIILPNTKQTISICKGSTTTFTTTIQNYSNTNTAKWFSRLGTNNPVEILNNFIETDGTKYEITHIPNGLNSYISRLKITNASNSVLSKNFYHSNVSSCSTNPFRSSDFTVNFYPENQVNLQPINQSVCFDVVASSVTFRTLASNTSNAVYKWQTFQNNSWNYITDNSIFNNTNTKDLKINISDQALHNTKYRAEITNTNNCGIPVFSNEATLSVLPLAKIISSTPSPNYYCVGGEINLAVEVRGHISGIPTWSRQQGNVSNPFTQGQQTNVQNTDGSQSIRLKITGADNSFNTNRFRVAIPTCATNPVLSSDIETRANTPLVQSNFPPNLNLCVGSSSQNITTALTTPNQQGISYQWQRKYVTDQSFTNIESNNNYFSFLTNPTSLTVNPITGSLSILDNAKVRLVYTNTCGVYNGGETSIRVYPPLAVQVSPSESVICIGSNISLNAVVNGPVTNYLWLTQIPRGTTYGQLDNNSNATFRVSGANSSNLSISNITNPPIPNSRHNTMFKVRVSGLCGSNIISTNQNTLKFANVEYANASVNIIPDKTYPTAGETIVFSTLNQIRLGPTPSYKWYVNNVLVPSATSNSLSLNNLSNGNVIKVEATPSVFCSGMEIAQKEFPITSIKNLIAINLKDNSNPHTFSIFSKDYNTTGLNNYTKNSLTQFSSIADDIDKDGTQDLGQLNLTNLSPLTSEIIIQPQVSAQNDDTPLKLIVDYTTNDITSVLIRNQGQTSFSTLDSDLYTIDRSINGLTKFKINAPDQVDLTNTAFDFYTTNLTNETELKSTDSNFLVTIKSGIILRDC